MAAGVISVPSIMPLRLPIAGKPKNAIDTNTLIELKTETRNTRIYYTVDGSRPDTQKRLGENTTLLYTEPFMLHSGKRTVKSLAQHKDLRESNVVTKTFSVEYAEPLSPRSSDSEVDNEDNFQVDMQRENAVMSNRITSSVMDGKPMAIKDAWHNPFVPELTGLNPRASHHATPRNHMQISTRGQYNSHQRSGTSMQAYSVHDLQEKHIKRCVYCEAPRPATSKSRFCSECGKPVPVEGSADVEPSSMGMCVACRSYVPLNQPLCIVCEAPIKCATTTTTIRYENKITCGSCGKHNPPTLTHCSYCEHRFPMAVHSGEAAPPLPKLDGRLIRCPTCLRVNNPDARFCDWCGTKPVPEQSPLTCSMCKTNNPPYSRYCGHCGSTFIPPNRMDPRNSDLGDETCDGYKFKNLPMWKEIPYPSVPRSPQSTRLIPPTRVRQRSETTQTVGLFFPGGKKVAREQEELMEIRSRELRLSDKNPPLTAVSPGRGYWRKQLDHVCGHLRAYTTNNVEFRSIIGEPRLGKVTGAGIDEGENEMTISFTFNLFENSEVSSQSRALQRDIYKQNKTFAFGSTLKEDSEKENKNKSGKKKKKMKKRTILNDHNSNPEDRLLLKEVSGSGSGRVRELKQLLMEGADVNCTDSDKRTALALAVTNEQTECVKALIHAGANVNAPSGPNHDTALHEAVKLGPSGKNIVAMLLEKDANISVKNSKGLTPYDLAVKSDYNSIVALFTTHKGKSIVNKMTKPRGYKKSDHKLRQSDDSDSVISEDDVAVF